MCAVARIRAGVPVCVNVACNGSPCYSVPCTIVHSEEIIGSLVLKDALFPPIQGGADPSVVIIVIEDFEGFPPQLLQALITGLRLVTTPIEFNDVCLCVYVCVRVCMAFSIDIRVHTL